MPGFGTRVRVCEPAHSHARGEACWRPQPDGPPVPTRVAWTPREHEPDAGVEASIRAREKPVKLLRDWVMGHDPSPGTGSIWTQCQVLRGIAAALCPRPVSWLWRVAGRRGRRLRSGGAPSPRGARAPRPGPPQPPREGRCRPASDGPRAPRPGPDDWHRGDSCYSPAPTRIPALPFCHVQLKGSRPPDPRSLAGSRWESNVLSENGALICQSSTPAVRTTVPGYGDLGGWLGRATSKRQARVDPQQYIWEPRHQ